MRIQRSCKNVSGVRTDVLLRVRALEGRCEALEREMDTLALAERLRQAMMRIAELEREADAKSAA